MLDAAGILFVDPDGRVLLLRRSAEGDHAGEWSLPGGKVERGETAREAALREAREEIGWDPKAGSIADVVLLARRQAEGVDWTTFQVNVPQAFDARLNGEHDQGGWFYPSEAPEPMHPGAQLVLERLDMDEMDIARAVRDGRLTSPQRYENIALVAMRITGTGMAYREGHDEYVWREPSLYLNPEFLARCNGLPVVIEHPKGKVLDSAEFASRVVGTIALPYVKSNEVWGIAKIYDASTIQMIEDHRLSTSPAVVFRDPTANTTERLPDGETLLIEGKPSLLDHLAICEQGVWDKGGQPTGVATTATATNGDTAVPDDMDPNAKADQGGAPAAPDKMDEMLGRLDAIATRLDALEGGPAPAVEDPEPSAPVKPMPAAADADGEEFPPEITSMPRETDADRMRFDMACAGYKADRQAKADAAAAAEAEGKATKEGLVRMDSVTAAMRKELDELRARLTPPAEEESREMAAEQVRADAVYAQHGASAGRPLAGETLLAYRRRMAQGLQAHSDAWKGIDLGTLPAAALEIATTAIYADAAKAARNPVDVPLGQLREIVTQDSTGRRITSFVGEPRSWMEQFGGTRRRVTGINNGSR